ncbi:MAG: dual specificity protein phosphatase family protein [Thermomicrobiales bacterium]
MDGFYWLEPGALAGCGRPGSRYRADVAKALEQDLSFLEDQGIGAVLTLTETPLADEVLGRFPFASKHIPITDMTAPSADQLRAALGFIDEQRAEGRAVVVHCLVGQGRTGTILAAYLIRGGVPPEDALDQVRAVCPHAVENEAQESSLTEFAASRGWLV